MSGKTSSINEKGQEVLDNTPVAIPVRFQRVKNLSDQIRETLRSEEFRAYLNSQELETPEEADDFEVGDDYDPRSPYEMSLDQELRGPEDDERERQAANPGGQNRTTPPTEPDRTEGDERPRRVRRSRRITETDEERPRRHKRSSDYDDDELE